jgi:crotonobetainyl-CoA:carnitine CoA-transferase CaiB-like acyl-CoA transferase
MADGALGDLLVVDFSRVLAGPLATMVLGDLGAEVVKVERPDGGDDTRSWGPPFDADGEATYFQAVNRNKRSVSLDLRSDREEVLAMCARADVLVENFRPGVMDSLGLGWEELRAANPRLVYCSITGFGQGSTLPGYDLLVQAVGGLMSITGGEQEGPVKVGVALVDVVAGLFALAGILAAVRHRDVTSGRGQRVEIDLLTSLLAALVNQGSAWTQAGVVGARMGNAHPSIAPYEVFRGGELVIAVGNDRQFAALCSVLGDEGLASRFASNAERVARREELRERLEALLAARSAAEWVELLGAAGVPAGQVNDIAGAFELAERLGLAPIVEVGGVRLARNPIGLSETPPTYRLPPPALQQRR